MKRMALPSKKKSILCLLKTSTLRHVNTKKKKKWLSSTQIKKKFQVEVFKCTTRLGPCVNQFICSCSHTRGDIYPFNFHIHTKLYMQSSVQPRSGNIVIIPFTVSFKMVTTLQLQFIFSSWELMQFFDESVQCWPHYHFTISQTN